MYHCMARGMCYKTFYGRNWLSSGLFNNSFTIVIYDRNDSGQYYKIMIRAKSI